MNCDWLHHARLSASGKEDCNSTQDVKELTPEFYYLPDFLVNANHLPLGTRQDGRVVNNVELPPWSRGCPREFIMMHRRALESECVLVSMFAPLSISESQSCIGFAVGVGGYPRGGCVVSLSI